MARTIGFGRLPSVHGGRGILVAVGTAASLVNAGSFSIQYSSAGSKVLRNVLVPIVTNANSVYGTGVVVEATGSSDGYVAVTLWDVGSGDVAVNRGTVDVNFVVFGGYGST